jgi:hypothetical protein
MEGTTMSSLSDKTGGPAFPEPVAVGPAGDVYRGMSGMSLRDYFAAAALPAVIAATSAGQHVPKMRDGENTIHQAIARDVFEVADAMIAARLLDAANSEVRG